MVFNPAQLWRRLFHPVAILLMSGLISTILVKHILSVNVHPASVIPINQSNSHPAQITSTVVQNKLNDQWMALSQLYRSAPKWSVDELVKREDSQFNDLISTTTLEIPLQYKIEAHPSNYGDRLVRDMQGKPFHNRLLIVLHETTSAASGAINTALTPHVKDEDQVSYHAVICTDGTIVYLVDPRKRAYGAGNSVFRWREGFETVQTNKQLKSSVNNFAYHISLETPTDGYNANTQHSGYSSAQYDSLAWLIAQSGVEKNRITTHFAIDRLGERQDPRSFEMDWLNQNLVLQNVDWASTDAMP